MTSLPEQLARTRRFTLGAPDRFALARGGAAVLFVRGRDGEDPLDCLWALDLDSGTERLLADPAELSGPTSVGIGAFATGGSLVAFAHGGSLWTVDVGGGPVRRLPVEGPVTDPRPDPSGTRVAYVRDGALRVVEADGTGDRAILVPGSPGVAFGVGEHTDDGYWWSPDGSRLLVTRVDAGEVALWHTTDPTRPDLPARAFRYAAVGQANADVALWIAGLDGTRAEVQWDRGAFEYLVDASWTTHGPSALVQSRDQQTVRFLGIDAVSGATTVRHEQRDACWVQVVPGLPARTGAGAVVAHADEPGTRRLTVDGVAVTPPGLQLRAVLDVDGDDVLFTASDEPTETHLWRWRAADGLRRLSSGPGVHSGVRRSGTLVQVAHGPESPGGRVTVVREGKPPVPLASLVARPVLDVHATQLVLGPRELRAALYLPSWHRSGDRLPVLLDPYGGAARQRVTTELDWRSLVAQWFAEQGFAVLVADGAGTPGRGPAWEREVRGDLLGPVLDDQVTALHEAARRYPELDLDRVGIRGWSFGGSLAMFAVLRRPDVFHAAVAGAGVTDQRLYNARWRERFLGHPAGFPDRYDALSLVSAAPSLTRPLLLMHGLADDNVHPANTVRLSAALLAAGRPYEVVFLPGAGHQVMGSPFTVGVLRRQLGFLQHHLASPARSGDIDRFAANPHIVGR
ncbi:prolyl oligopeptidase family serine peptidase [Amycolatopsis sp. NBC_00345]|uniref:S9 family peptidase n=1 Tax=Amycolatopsis sp. NBC_00345 TaxID=2975955 RepID=UPI002E25A899